MKDILIQKGFKFVGSCNCHGGTSWTYEHPSVGGYRMEVGSSSFWVKQIFKPNPNWNTIDFGNMGRFEEALTKYFNI